MDDLIRQQANVNRVDIHSPAGRAVYSGPNRSRLDIALTPAQQNLYNIMEGTQTQLANVGSQLAGSISPDPISFEGLQALPGLNDFSEDRQRVEEALFERTRSLLDPTFANQEEALRESLSARGLSSGGSESGRRELENFYDRRNEAYNQAAREAVAAGGAEQSRMFANALTGRQQGLSERQLAINEPLSRVSMLLGQTTPQQPMVMPPQPIDVMGPAQLQQQGQIARSSQVDPWLEVLGAGASLLPFAFF